MLITHSSLQYEIAIRENTALSLVTVAKVHSLSRFFRYACRDRAIGLSKVDLLSQATEETDLCYPRKELKTIAERLWVADLSKIHIKYKVSVVCNYRTSLAFSHAQYRITAKLLLHLVHKWHICHGKDLDRHALDPLLTELFRLFTVVSNDHKLLSCKGYNLLL